MRKDVLVIGAGQAGLAAGFHLRRMGLPFSVVDHSSRVGDAWRQRYDGLTLFTPRQFSALPGMEIPGNREGYPERDEFADYLEAYAERFALPVRLRTHITRLTKSGDTFEATLADGEPLHASNVIVATGGFQLPVVPEISRQFGPDVLQLTVDTFRNPAQLPDGPVLVVGDGASGRDIAVACAELQPAMLATGKPRRLFPERILGKSIWWWLRLTGALKKPANSFLGNRIKAADAFPDRQRNTAALEAKGVRIVTRLAGADTDIATFSDGRTAQIRTVIWATGYRDDTTWIDIPGALAPDNAVLHDAGVSPVTGLYFVGKPWQRNRASALIMGAGEDARFIVETLTDRKN